jgi:hypothetical protein
MAPNNRFLALAFTAALTVVPRAEATLARVMKFDDKVENAASIIVGKCVATRSQWDAEHRWILTYSTFQVEDAIKGRATTEITIVTPGGEVGGLHQDTIGVPAFRQGDENVVFTKNTNLGPTVLYFDQGTYDVGLGDRDSRIVTPRPTGAVLVDTQRGTAYEPEHARTLGEFKREVHDSMERTRAQKMELIRGRKQQPSIASLFLHYKLLIALAVIGATIATIQLIRR